jgi:hypothetical protein
MKTVSSIILLLTLAVTKTQAQSKKPIFLTDIVDAYSGESILGKSVNINQVCNLRFMVNSDTLFANQFPDGEIEIIAIDGRMAFSTIKIHAKFLRYFNMREWINDTNLNNKKLKVNRIMVHTLFSVGGSYQPTFMFLISY